MNRTFSLYLDALRAFAAILVVVSHWAYARFTGGDFQWIRDHDLGGEAVTIFFVMSGLVIAATADRRAEEGLAAFTADRLSRLWIVAIPALALTLLLDPIGLRAAPELYEGYFQGDNPLARSIVALTFTNESLGQSVRPFSNGPWWSLGYEAVYYAIFAAAFFLRGDRRIACVGALALLAGWKILLLMPIWLMGVGLWRLIRSGRLAQLPLDLAWALVLTPLALYGFAHALYLPDTLKAFTEAVVGPRIWNAIDFSDTFLWATLLGALVTMHIAGVAALAAQSPVRSTDLPAQVHTIVRIIKWIAGGSFALYLFHYPILQVLGAVMPGETAGPWRQAALLVGTLVLPFLLAEVTERRREGLRRALRWLFSRLGNGHARPT